MVLGLLALMMSSVSATQPPVVAVDNDGRVFFYDTDVSDWDMVGVGSSGFWGIVYASELDRWVTVGRSGEAAYSDDGVNWNMISDLDGVGWLRAVDYSSDLGLFITVAGMSVYSSVDGIEWSLVTTLPYSPYGVAYNDVLGLWVAVSAVYPHVYTSVDGMTWNTIEISPYAEMYDVAYSSVTGRTVIVGDSADVRYSDDGVSWTNTGGVGSYNIYAVTYSSDLDLFVAVGGTWNDNVVAYSSDGANWDVTSVGSVNSYLYGVTYSELLESFVAVGDNGAVAYSSDGVNWDSTTVGAVILRDVAAVPRAIVPSVPPPPSRGGGSLGGFAIAPSPPPFDGELPEQADDRAREATEGVWDRVVYHVRGFWDWIVSFGGVRS